MKISDISTEIYLENGSPTTTSIPAIAFWLRSKMGSLNTLLFEEFSLNDGLELVNSDGTEITPEVVAIVKQLYRVYDLEVQVRTFMNALASDGLLSVQDNLGGTSFTRVNRNEVSKTLISMRKDELAFLDKLITSYRSRSSRPQQVAGDDTQVGIYPHYTSFVPYVRTY